MKCAVGEGPNQNQHPPGTALAGLARIRGALPRGPAVLTEQADLLLLRHLLPVIGAPFQTHFRGVLFKTTSRAEGFVRSALHATLAAPRPSSPWLGLPSQVSSGLLSSRRENLVGS